MENSKNKYGDRYLGKVIRILSEKELVIDVGDDYLTIGDTVIIYTVGDEIIDLDGNSLGLYEHDKATLEVITTTSKYSICATPKQTEQTTSLLDYSSMFSKTIIKQDNLNVSTEDIESIFVPNKDKIVKGDFVKKA